MKSSSSHPVVITVGVIAFVLWCTGIYFRSFWLTTLAAFYSFPSMHDASHGSAPEWLGYLSSIPLLVPFPEFRLMHKMHHAYTNDPHKDPDHITQRNPLAWFFIPEVYIAYFIPIGTMEGIMRYLCFVFGVILYALIWKWDVLYLVLPSRIAFMLLVVLLDVIPHVDRKPKPAQTTKNFYEHAPWWFFMLTGGQCYHEMHHENPKIPWPKLKPSK